MQEKAAFPGVSFVENTGEFSFETEDFSFRGIKPLISSGGKNYFPGNWKRVDSPGVKECFEGSTPLGKLFFSIEPAPEKIVFSLHVKLRKPRNDFQLLYMENGISSTPAEHLFTMGMRSGERTLLATAGKEKKEFRNMNFCLTVNGKEIFFSYPMGADFLPVSYGSFCNGKIRISSGVHIRHSSLTELAAPPLTVHFGEGFRLLARYGEENITEKKSFPEKIPCGWNSWDYYRWTITEEEVLENARFIASDPVLSRHVKKIIIDDGWQYAYGEWEPNSLFPSGMGTLARKLRDMGFTPGLWIAPFLVEPHARIAQKGYDMLARTEKGLPGMFFNCMERRGFLLDPTLQKTREFWHALFEKYARMGYGYFKLDFLSPIYDVPRLADETVSRGKLLELLFATVKDAIGGEKEIMACGYLRGCGNRFIHAARIGEDIHATWEAVKANTPSLAALYWANRKLWVNDPDFALARTVETEKDKEINLLRPCLCYINNHNDNEGCFHWKLVENHLPQTEVLLSLVIASGGAVNLSDCMMKLDERELALARKCVSAAPGGAAVPLDLFCCDPLPEKWLQKGKNFSRLLLINWSNAEKEFTVDLEALGLAGGKIKDFWKEREIPLKNGILTNILPPCSCLFAEIQR